MIVAGQIISVPFVSDFVAGSISLMCVMPALYPGKPLSVALGFGVHDLMRAVSFLAFTLGQNCIELRRGLRFVGMFFFVRGFSS